MREETQIKMWAKAYKQLLDETLKERDLSNKEETSEEHDKLINLRATVYVLDWVLKIDSTKEEKNK